MCLSFVLIDHVDSVGDKLRLEYGKSVGMVEKINTRVDAFIDEQLQAHDGGVKLQGSVQGAPPTKPFVNQEIPTPVPVRTSSRTTKACAPVRLEDEATPEKVQLRRASRVKQSELVKFEIKVARLEGQAESHACMYVLDGA